MLYVQCSMVWSLFEGLKKTIIRSHAITKETLIIVGKCKEIFKKSQPPIDSKIQLDALLLFDE